MIEPSPVDALAETGIAYDDLLAASDPRLRRERGIYSTPAELVGAQCRLVARLLDERLGRPLAFADEGVLTLDPGAGTGAYALAALAEGLRRVRRVLGAGAVPERAAAAARNLRGYEILPGACVVARRRLLAAVRAYGGELPAGGARIEAVDVLARPPDAADEAAPVLVCLGNPPYHRQHLGSSAGGRARKGGWVRFGLDGERPILEDFLAPARQAGLGVHLKNLYNDYVYFWRWALWRALECRSGPAIVSLVTASSYLRGPAFVGMRRAMRAGFDELWLLDLGGDGRGARRSENVFPVRTPVAIAFGVRRAEAHPGEPARVRYARLAGSREAKLAALGRIERFEELDWRDCAEGWAAPFLPVRPPSAFDRSSAPGRPRSARSRNAAAIDHEAWPRLAELFPRQSSGVQLKRTWPVGETEEVLERRWRALVSAPLAQRAALFGESRDRKVDRDVPPLPEAEPASAPGRRLPALAALDAGAAPPPVVRYGYRSFDRRWLLLDPRLGDYLRPRLWRAHSERQLYLTSLLTKPLGPGPAATVTAQVPDLDHFSNRGGRDVVPLWLDAAATEPNVAPGLLDRLADSYGVAVTPEDLFAYAYALLASPAYARRFADELAELADLGPRLPLTRDARLFQSAAGLGRGLVFLHTRGERFGSPGGRPGGTPGEVPPVRARYRRPIPRSPGALPEGFSYDRKRRALRVGAGEIAPVAPEVWAFSVSGFRVVRSWLAHRVNRRAGRRSSPLDAIRPERWMEETSAELLGLLRLLAATVALFPALERSLDEILAGPSLTAPGRAR
jgi:hypothetical protein